MTAYDVRQPRRKDFSALASGGLDFESLPLRLFRKGHAKAWNPADLDFSRDAEDWARLDDVSREAFTGLCAMFLAGEEAVTHDLQPFMAAMSSEGRLADEMYLTQFCYEEAKHTEVFRMWLDAVGLHEDLNGLVADNPGYRRIFFDALPESLDRLRHAPTPQNQVRASVTYNHVVEGVLALTGYFAWTRICTELNIFPGMRRMIARIRDDERRHMAWGTYTCRRLVAADPDNWQIVTHRMRELLPHAIRQIQHATRDYPADLFGLVMRDLLEYATECAGRRLHAIESALSETSGGLRLDTVSENLEEEIADEERRALAAPGEGAFGVAAGRNAVAG
ncbi:R2-like ligand-binding oxidase [Streptomyces xiamenensis]|uniref:R2-like ligand-binding oxidase n=1 Tax=Streptomyces xiamenensis TaxID=408015 RepID=UPI003421E7ED